MVNEKLKQFIVPQFWKKFCIMIVGIFFMGFFLSFLLEINWGTDPFSFQNDVISQRIHWQFGTWQMVLNIALLIIMVIFNWHLIGLGTLANMFLIGYISDFFRWVWTNFFPGFMTVCHDPSLIWLKVIVFVAVLLLFVISASLYMNADMGLSPYDGIAYIFCHSLKKIPIAISRIAYDLFAVVVGVVVSIGSGINIVSALVGSIAMALTLGPAIQIVGNFVNKKILKVSDK